MKITFEEDGAKVVMDLPGINPRASLKALNDFGCHPLDAAVEIMQKAEGDLETILSTRVRIDKEGNKAQVLRLVAMWVAQVDPGTPVDFWDTLVKMQKK